MKLNKHICEIGDPRSLFVGPKSEIGVLRKSIIANEAAVIKGRRGAGKSTLVYHLESEIKTHCPGGFFSLEGRDGSTKIHAFLDAHYDGFAERAFVLLRNSQNSLSDGVFRELFLRLSELRNLQVVATVSKSVEGLEKCNLISLGHC